MSEACSGWTITYNGEIYNYLEVRRELVGLGWSFNGHSDTEVLLKAWSQWGVAALSRLNGMFAFAVANDRTGELWLVRDRFGVKPLYWSRNDSGGLTFSSSIAAVAADVRSEVNLDYCAFGSRYLAFEASSDTTPFVSVKALEPGTWMKCQLNESGLKVTSGVWYDLKYQVQLSEARLSGLTDDALIELSSHLLKDAVKLRLRSDVPIGVSLSGGVDSSSVAAIASDSLEKLSGFTFGAPSFADTEGPVVKSLSAHLGIDANYVWPDMSPEKLDAMLERTLVAQEAPFPSLSVIAQNEIFRTARTQGFKVMLGGQGGDEIFAGYRKFVLVACHAAYIKRDPKEVLRLLYSLGLICFHELSNSRIFLNSIVRYFPNQSGRFKTHNLNARPVNLWGERGLGIRGRQIEDIQKWSLPTLLRYEDRNSMGNGVESRLPFMDFRLVEMALALPTRLKIANGFGKFALRKAVSGRVPNQILTTRKKRGFDIKAPWIDRGLGEVIRRRLYANEARIAEYVRPGYLNDLSDAALSSSEKLLAEALLLVWLTEPIRASA